MNYSQIVEKLKSGKEKGTKEAAQEVVLFFLTEVRNTTQKTYNYQDLANFSLDKAMIFFSHFKEISNKNVDFEVISNGLLYELLIINCILDAKEISEAIADALEDLHIALSSNAKDIEEIRASTLKTIDNYIEKLRACLKIDDKKE